MVALEEMRIETVAGKSTTEDAAAESRLLAENVFKRLIAARTKASGDILLDFRSGETPLIRALGRRILVTRGALLAGTGQDELATRLAFEIVLIDVDDAAWRYQRPVIASFIDAKARQGLSALPPEDEHRRYVQVAAAIVIEKRLGWSKSETCRLVVSAGYTCRSSPDTWKLDPVE
ncbi:hypothetical protein ACFSM5_17260 [Lacibacterium aquatile]|uniref:Uncharacterized protein n=1 Tax=Lacibacterium aquatile TaxID=1168082 RepID=A0ABW5DU46_9PROT